MENKVTISELPELPSVSGAESIPVDTYDAEQEKIRTFRVSIEAIRDFVESKLSLGEVVTQEQILEWDAKETTLGAQEKANASLVLAKEYTDEELVTVKAAISVLEGLFESDDETLDELQEIVNFIKLNRSDLDSLTTASIAGLDGALEDKVDLATMTSVLEDKADVSALEDKVDLATMTSALEDKADVSALEDKVDSDYLDLALADKADVAVDFVTVAEAYTIEEKDLGKVLYVTADVTLTVSDQATLTEGFNCKIIKAEDTLTVGVELTGSDSIRGDIETIVDDVTLIKAPVAGKFLLV